MRLLQRFCSSLFLVFIIWAVPMNLEVAVDIFDGLNPAQKKAVEHLDGPLLIMAGAGSGKTKVLTCKIANLLAHGVAPYNILAITFTNRPRPRCGSVPCV